MAQIRTPRAVVIAAGSPAHGDDGVGGAVLSVLGDLPGLDGAAVLARCDGDPAALIELWDGFEHAVVVAAARGGIERVGYVYRSELLRGDGAMGFVPSGRGCGFGQAVRLADVLGRLPRRLSLYAVHGHDFAAGDRISRAVAALVPTLAGRIRQEVLTAGRATAAAETAHVGASHRSRR